jgi:hypothetical protein
MFNASAAHKLAETGEAEHSCTGCGQINLKASIPVLSAIPRKSIRAAAYYCATMMDTEQRDQMIEMESIIVNCDGTLRWDWVKLDNQDDPEERWDDEYQPLTSAKAIADCACSLLVRWQTSMLWTYTRDTEKKVFAAKGLESLEELVKQGNMNEVLEAIKTLRITTIKNLDPNLRY